MAPLRRADAPLDHPPREKGVQWIRPVLAAEIAYAERTDDGILRQASFLGLREDKPAKTVKAEKAEPPPGIKITHPERLIWPSLGIRKIDLARYCEEVMDWLLPHVADRPLTMV